MICRLLTESQLPFTGEQLRDFWVAMDGRYFDQDEGVWQDDKDYGTCTYANQAPFKALTRAGHTVEVWGAAEHEFSDLPFSQMGMMTGHDWGLVDGRWIIDVWANAYLDQSLPVVYDLQDKADAALASHYYPDRSKWILVYSDYMTDKSAETHRRWQQSSGTDWDNLFSNVGPDAK